MTAWADYSYYTAEYLDGRTPTVSEADFRSYAVSATAYAKRFTGDAISDDAPPEEARHAVCAIAEVLAQSEAARCGGITSEKVGDLSVTYDANQLRGELMRIIRTWLAPWCFMGVTR